MYSAQKRTSRNTLSTFKLTFAAVSSAAALVAASPQAHADQQCGTGQVFVAAAAADTSQATSTDANGTPIVTACAAISQQPAARLTSAEQPLQCPSGMQLAGTAVQDASQGIAVDTSGTTYLMSCMQQSAVFTGVPLRQAAPIQFVNAPSEIYTSGGGYSQARDTSGPDRFHHHGHHHGHQGYYGEGRRHGLPPIVIVNNGPKNDNGDPGKGQDGEGQGNNGQGNMGQGNNGQGNMGQGNMGQGNNGQGNMGQGNNGQGNMGQGNKGQGNNGQGNMGKFGKPGWIAPHLVHKPGMAAKPVAGRPFRTLPNQVSKAAATFKHGMRTVNGRGNMTNRASHGTNQMRQGNRPHFVRHSSGRHQANLSSGGRSHSQAHPAARRFHSSRASGRHG
jgi:hypothetical protein